MFNLEGRFQKDKSSLERKCADCEAEVKEMKARVAEMESKRTKLHDQLNSELQDVKADLRAARDDNAELM